MGKINQWWFSLMMMITTHKLNVLRPINIDYKNNDKSYSKRERWET